MKNNKAETEKTGAVICKMADKEKAVTYQALLFIRNVPDEVTDGELEALIRMKKVHFDNSGDNRILVRADVHSTSNEVQEQYEHLHPGDKPVPEMSYASLFSS